MKTNAKLDFSSALDLLCKLKILFVFYGISTFGAYLMPNHIYIYIYILLKKQELVTLRQ